VTDGWHRSRGRAVALVAVQVLVVVFVLADAYLLVTVVEGEGALPQPRLGHSRLPAVPAPPSPRTVDALRLPPRRGIHTIVSLTFDDGLSDQYALVTLLPAHHLTATVFANSGLLADEGYRGRMALSQLIDLAERGVEIGGHTADHADLTRESVAKARREVCGDRAQLLAWGFHVVSFAYPYSSADPRVRRLPRVCGYLSARSVGGVACPGCTAAETYPPHNRYSLRTPDPVEVHTSLRELKRQVRTAERSASAQAPTWLILTFHHICDGCSKDAISEHRLAALMDWLSHRPASTAVRTVGAVMLHGFR
jgi:peptidoglycan/xylan/chitin deacetylase (PgdA/CDA1 family)